MRRDKKTRDIQRKDSHIKIEMDIEVKLPKPRNAWGYQKLEEGSSPKGFRESRTPANILNLNFWPPKP